MCELMEDALLIDRHGEFGTFAHHSCLQVRQILAMAPSMYQSRIAGTWHDQLDRNCVGHARTIESTFSEEDGKFCWVRENCSPIRH